MACSTRLTNSAAPTRSFLAHRDHGPVGPNGPERRRSGFRVWEVGSRLSRKRRRDHLAATVPTTRGEPQGLRRTPGRRSTRAFRPGDPRLHRRGFASDIASTGRGRHGAIFQPVVSPAALPARSVPWFPSWFQASGSSASRRLLWAKPSARADRSDGNNCWRRSPVFSFYF
jgi:hypothetical protein